MIATPPLTTAAWFVNTPWEMVQALTHGHAGAEGSVP
jgi:hypothetical protein